MALSGSSGIVRLGTTGCEAKFDWVATQSGNKSTIKVTLFARRWSSGGWFTGGWNKAVITIGGKKSAVITIPGIVKGSNTDWKVQTSSTQVLQHGADGSLKSLISVHVYQTASTRFSHTIDANITVTPVAVKPSPTQPTPGTPLPVPSSYWGGSSAFFYMFDKNEKLIAIIPRSQIRQATRTEEINEPGFLDVTLTPKVDISAAVYIGHKYLAETVSMAYYKIMEINIAGEEVRIKGVESGFDDLFGKAVMEYPADGDKLISSWLTNDILPQTGWAVGTVTDDYSMYLDYYNISPLEGFQLLMDKTGYEFKFVITFNGSAITSKVIDVKPHFGFDRGKRFVHGSNLLQIIREDNRNNTFSSVLPIDTQMNTSGITSAVWTTPTNPVNKPLNQTWIEVPAYTAAFGYPNGGKRIKIIRLEHDEPSAMIQQAYDYILEHGRPQISYRTLVRDVGDTGLGDTVAVIRDDIGIRYKTRIYKRTIDLVDPTLVEIELGDKDRRDVTAQLARMRKELDTLLNKVEPY